MYVYTHTYICPIFLIPTKYRCETEKLIGELYYINIYIKFILSQIQYDTDETFNFK